MMFGKFLNICRFVVGVGIGSLSVVFQVLTVWVQKIINAKYFSFS